MSKSFHPCKKISSSAYSAKYLKRAESLARSIKAKYGSKSNIIDGCLIRGRKANRLLTAESIEPEGYALSSAVTVIGPDYTGGEPPPQDGNRHVYPLYSAFQVGGRETFHPLYGGGNGTDLSDVKPTYTSISGHNKAVYFGERSFGGFYTPNSHIALGETQPYRPSAGCHYLCLAGYRHDADYDMYFNVSARPALGLLNGKEYSIHFSDEFIKNVTGGYSIGFDDLPYEAHSHAVVEVGPGRLVAIFAVGKVIFDYGENMEHAPALSFYYYLTKKVETRLLLIDMEIDLEKLDQDELVVTPSFSLFPEQLIPPKMLPGEVLVLYDNLLQHNNLVQKAVPAPSWMSIQDAGLDDDGNVIVAVKYQVKVHNHERPNYKAAPDDTEYHYPGAYQGGLVDFNTAAVGVVGGAPFILDGAAGHEGTGVMAYGLASWGGEDSFFDVHSVEVVEPMSEDALISEFEVDPTTAYYGERQTIIGNDVYRWVVPVKRSSSGYAGITGRQYTPLEDLQRYEIYEPYVIELKNGVPTGNNGLSGPSDIVSIAKEPWANNYYGKSTSFEVDFSYKGNFQRNALSSEKARISDTCYAIPAGDDIGTETNKQTGFVTRIWSSVAGILFIDGDRRKFEPVAERDKDDGVAFSISCHQQEVRDKDGNLIVPASLIASTIKNGKAMIFVRNGPIWDEDIEGDSNFTSLGTWAEITPPRDQLGILSKYVYVGNQFMAGKHGNVFE